MSLSINSARFGDNQTNSSVGNPIGTGTGSSVGGTSVGSANAGGNNENKFASKHNLDVQA